MNNSEYDIACEQFLENVIKSTYGVNDRELLTTDVISNFENNVSNFINKEILFEELSINNEAFSDIFNFINKNLQKLTTYETLHIFLNFKTGAIEVIHKNKIYTISTQKNSNYYSFILKRGKYIVKTVNNAKSIHDLQKILDFLVKLK